MAGPFSFPSSSVLGNIIGAGRGSGAELNDQWLQWLSL